MSVQIALLSLYDYHAFGVRNLCGALEKKGINALCIFFKYFAFKMEPASERELDILLEVLRKASPQFVGLSVLSTFLGEATRISHRIRKELNIPVIWGGIHPTLQPGECNDIADFIFIGDAEESLADFLVKFRDYSPGNVLSDSERTFNYIPQNAVHSFKMHWEREITHENKYFIEEEEIQQGDPLYFCDNFLKDYNGAYRTLASRGCPYCCSYCSNDVLRKHYGSQSAEILRRPVEELIDELKNAKTSLCARTIIFMDECFATDRKWLKDFCKAYKSEVCLPFYCEMHPQIIENDLVDILCESGLTSTSIGIQSGSELIRKELFNRSTENRLLLEKTEILRKFDITVHYEVITDNPYESEKDKAKAIEFLLQLPRPLNLNIFSLNYFPCTEITRKALSEGIIGPGDVEGLSNRGMRQFILKYPYDGKDKFLNYLYCFLSDLFCSSGNTAGLRSHCPPWLIERLMKSSFLKKFPGILILFARGMQALSGMSGVLKLFLKKLSFHIPKKPILLLKVFLSSLIIPFLVRILSPSSLFKILDSKKVKKINDNNIKKIISYTDYLFSLRPWRKLKNICLVRSSILFYMLRREGLDVTINIGIKKSDSDLKGHGWLTLNGCAYLETSDFWKDFEVMYSFPA